MRINELYKDMKDKRIYGLFGHKIKEMRLEHGLRQRQLAELLETDKPMYSKMELGARRVRRDQVPKLAKLYQISEKELMTQRNTFLENDGFLSELYRFQTTCFE